MIRLTDAAHVIVRLTRAAQALAQTTDAARLTLRLTHATQPLI